jgi:hypothetical protein
MVATHKQGSPFAHGDDWVFASSRGTPYITITLDIYTHLFEDARHARDIRTRMAASPFAGLLEPTTARPGATVRKLR